MKRVEVDAVTSFIKFYEVESFSDAEVYTDDDDYESEKDGVNEFRYYSDNIQIHLEVLFLRLIIGCEKKNS